MTIKPLPLCFKRQTPRLSPLEPPYHCRTLHHPVPLFHSSLGLQPHQISPLNPTVHGSFGAEPADSPDATGTQITPLRISTSWARSLCAAPNCGDFRGYHCRYRSKKPLFESRWPRWAVVACFVLLEALIPALRVTHPTSKTNDPYPSVCLLQPLPNSQQTWRGSLLRSWR